MATRVIKERSTIKICLGGSFDPVHQGHLTMALGVADYFGACVSLVPNRIPPHREALRASSNHRYRMLQLACDATPQIEVDDLELKRDGLSYTLDTLQALRANLGEASIIIWCVGEDAFATIDTWHGWRHLLDWGHLLIMGRPHITHTASYKVKTFRQTHQLTEPKQLLSSPKGCIATININPVNISATAIRHSLHQGVKLDSHILPKPVSAYITQHHLYTT